MHDDKKQFKRMKIYQQKKLINFLDVAASSDFYHSFLMSVNFTTDKVDIDEYQSYLSFWIEWMLDRQHIK
jgi:hypothetical protein